MSDFGMKIQNPMANSEIISIKLIRKESEVRRDELLYKLDKKISFGIW